METNSTLDCGYTEPLATPNPYHDVVIQKVHNGFVVQVGCKKFVAFEWAELSRSLAEYWTNPRKAERKYVHNDPS